ncbi:S1C family serine protease [Nonomuraea africana]|uniref:S1-C subfamily serine protease n=1 Tax=Nonomuraea africana TaxID=46171 RepID=A0ABR9KWB9_9ACTN|nr:trypsin-like peptidase domain-containing protein [Nonomuraea africana]MBE1565827.1 S1-C subfamily serine protease [Nonomuraea africana]
MRMIVAGVCTAALLISGCSGSISRATPPVTTPAPATTAAATGATTSARALEAEYERVIQDVLPSIVQITTKVGVGSGIVYDSAGHIVTNAHVVGEATEMQVTLATGGRARPARLVSSFPAGDLAVIKVMDPSGLEPARFGDSGKLRVGQIVLAMGNPLGLSGSVTNGIVSALGRTVTEPEGPGGAPGATLTNAIQTSAAINPGNSGGALVDLSGQVIGIPTLAAVDPGLGGAAAPGIGFAIPSNTATDIAAQIVKDGRVTNSRKAALGIAGRTVIGPTGSSVGVGIVTVTRGGGADQAGIAPGDVIISVNGTATPSMSALSEVLAGLKPGDQAKVEVTKPDGTTSTVTVTLGELDA